MSFRTCTHKTLDIHIKPMYRTFGCNWCIRYMYRYLLYSRGFFFVFFFFNSFSISDLVVIAKSGTYRNSKLGRKVVVRKPKSRSDFCQIVKSRGAGLRRTFCPVTTSSAFFFFFSPKAAKRHPAQGHRGGTAWSRIIFFIRIPFPACSPIQRPKTENKNASLECATVTDAKEKTPEVEGKLAAYVKGSQPFAKMCELIFRCTSKPPSESL